MICHGILFVCLRYQSRNIGSILTFISTRIMEAPRRVAELSGKNQFSNEDRGMRTAALSTLHSELFTGSRCAGEMQKLADFEMIVGVRNTKKTGNGLGFRTESCGKEIGGVAKSVF
jgi:hypothetical protein